MALPRAGIIKGRLCVPARTARMYLSPTTWIGLWGASLRSAETPIRGCRTGGMDASVVEWLAAKAHLPAPGPGFWRPAAWLTIAVKILSVARYNIYHLE